MPALFKLDFPTGFCQLELEILKTNNEKAESRKITYDNGDLHVCGSLLLSESGTNARTAL